MFCGYCGKENADDYSFCSECGKTLKSDVRNKDTQSTSPPIISTDTHQENHDTKIHKSDIPQSNYISVHWWKDCEWPWQAKDSQNDIAVLKLAKSPSTQIPDLKFGDSSKVRPGDKVFTIGYPASSILGENQKITDGIISSITGINDGPTMFQITVPIQPGNSGGPLFNEKGEVIGITTASLSLNAIQSLGAVPQNVNYAIKSSFVNNLLTTIPKTLLSNRGIVVVPNNPGNSLSDFFERVSNNIVLIEAR